MTQRRTCALGRTKRRPSSTRSMRVFFPLCVRVASLKRHACRAVPRPTLGRGNNALCTMHAHVHANRFLRLAGVHACESSLLFAGTRTHAHASPGVLARADAHACNDASLPISPQVLTFIMVSTNAPAHAPTGSSATRRTLPRSPPTCPAAAPPTAWPTTMRPRTRRSTRRLWRR